MGLRITCPNCAHGIRLREPLPMPGDPLHCPACARNMAVSYPPGLVDRLREAGHRFATAPEPSRATGEGPSVSGGLSAHDDLDDLDDPAYEDAPTMTFGFPRARGEGAPGRGMPEGWEELITEAGLPKARAPKPPTPRAPAPDRVGHARDPAQARKPVPADGKPASADGKPASADTSAARPTRPAVRPPWIDDRPPAAPKPPRPFWQRVAIGVGATFGVALLALGIAYQQVASTLPSIETLRAYKPATVTHVYAKDGTTLLGEIYEQKRFVLPLNEIPEVVQNAFIAAEDASFWEHGGVDFMGIARAMGRNLMAGRVAQGGSTITQQVAKVFLLTNDRKLERKVKEAILSWRIEEAYTKEHILYLYLNEIFLGSQAYGVEAASRTFFGKHVADLTLAEASILAGLPPRPSDYNPHANIELAKQRQTYVLEQMVRRGMVTQADADAARAQEIKVVTKSNVFLDQTPHFTEYARRYLVEKYGEERVLHEGLHVITTCDPKLQQDAQRIITSGVHEMDERLGLRRDAITNLKTEAERTARIDEHELAMKKRWLQENDGTGKLPLPERSTLEVGRTYEGVVTQVSRRWARVRVGSHEGVIPVAWAEWAYAPDPEQSFKWRQQDDLTRRYDVNGDGKTDGSILQAGDVLRVKVEALSTKEKKIASLFAGSPGEKAPLVALRLQQVPEVESALLSLDLATGAVRAMVGGADFERSQLNRAVQAYRQVGSTFKPIVYAAALQSKKLTAASIIPDAEIAIVNERTGEVWKPQNYSGNYLGNITMRKALAQSRNTCTIRALDQIDPRASTGVIYDFARALGIGGPPTHLLPPDWVSTPETDHLCPWVPESVDNVQSCKRYPALPAGIDLKAHRDELVKGTSPKYKCRECDLSMGLGSASLTMEELARAYAVFGNGGVWTQPYYIEEVRDRDGNVLERHDPGPPVQVISPELATIMTWMLQEVVNTGTAYAARAELGMHIAGKTGTTNDEKDAWFVGYTPDVLTAVWVGYDQPRSLGRSATGGQVALPLWIDYMRIATPKETDRKFPEWGEVEWATINEWSGKKTAGWGQRYPFLPGTVPAQEAPRQPKEATLDDLATEL